MLISIHAPREGSDKGDKGDTGAQGPFLSTLPARGATLCAHGVVAHEAISIHAPREGSDFCPSSRPPTKYHFYPRSPRGERRHRCLSQGPPGRFLSTLPARGATPTFAGDAPALEISIHAPREGSDRLLWEHWENLMGQFLSTLPARGATSVCRHPGIEAGYFYPRSPRGERRPER